MSRSRATLLEGYLIKISCAVANQKNQTKTNTQAQSLKDCLIIDFYLCIEKDSTVTIEIKCPQKIEDSQIENDNLRSSVKAQSHRERRHQVSNDRLQPPGCNRQPSRDMLAL
ncbi:uncharacterized protein Bfra_001448 [Botrytis fragariae]|uniref:Uncharacterized protein n=1 Tax=Botrytis fragariae TaxID=1964551 RepID=A0A8H6B0Y7_9HELO|nr:uncharacterized protein Bfra_001448 [Botrytis fragariae]KAF5877087.1 hypothetical protein Bfra_001448 [Botrytis fragariae]